MTLLTELHVREYLSRQKRQDEINAVDYKQSSDRSHRVKSQANTWRHQAISNAGPMCLLDAVGQAEESWLEFLEASPRCELPARPRSSKTLELGLQRT